METRRSVLVLHYHGKATGLIIQLTKGVRNAQAFSYDSYISASQKPWLHIVERLSYTDTRHLAEAWKSLQPGGFG